ncbi:type III pantothenate kinase [Flavobacteriaceae bacterium]|jgi:type III pantothenate kinase|nr:type III pantothenate kinase [Flavobacteriaceae bacterium]MDC3285964.1 type III pantothenate kinase [Flavobacteriaceae bacterium]MDC3318470.1 type III pantothenate kinase [Flavobacteriaceae bacterium]
MNLVIDIGNTKVKVAVFELDTIITAVVCEEINLVKELKRISNQYTFKRSIVSSVKDINEEYLEELQKLPFLIILNTDTPLPFKNLYATPSTLGNDRIALAAAAVCIHPFKNTLVIDAGTCITYDFINAKNEYLGGAISPGIAMRYKSLHQYTGNLPLLSKNEEFNIIGTSTKSSIHSGIINGISCEIKGVIAQYKQDFGDLTIVLTGGDTKFLSKQLKNSIFAHQNFLLRGLNKILTFNNQ